MKHSLRSSNTVKIVVTAVIVILLISIISLLAYSQFSKKNIEVANDKTPHLQELLVLKAKKHIIELKYDLPARTTAYNIAAIRPQISGVVVKRIFTEGSFVKKGQSLYQIDPIEKVTIKAPISGLISRSAVTQGALVTQNQAEPLAVITQLDPIYVDIPVASKEMLEIKNYKHKKVKLFIDGNEYPYTGSVKFSEAFLNKSTDSTILRTIFKNPKGKLLSGMYVKAQIIVRLEDAITLSQRSVTISPNGDKYVMIVNEEGIIEKRAVKAKNTLSNEWIIDEGINDNDLVLYEGFQKVRVGMKISPKIKIEK